MENINVKINYAEQFLTTDELNAYQQQLYQIQASLKNHQTPGSDFLGWLSLPAEISAELLKDIQKTASLIKSQCDYFVVIGIGGSYLGARAVIEALSNPFDQYNPTGPKILYAGHNLSEDYLAELMEFLKDKRFSMTVISKSGTTTEPAVAFRLLKNLLESQVGKAEAAKRIVAVTDQSKGALKKLATEEGYKTYVVPDDVGGRFSVLTPVGLLPIAVAGFDIMKLVEGAKRIYNITNESSSVLINPAARYAAARNILHSKGFLTEILVSFMPKMQYFSEWWKQLYGESEGKDGKGIFPASVNFTTDLHSMGQYIQDGRRHIFETVVSIAQPNRNLTIPAMDEDLDGLNYLAGKNIEFVNFMAEKGTILAHNDGGVPVLNIHIPQLNEFYLGQLIYFFELACAYSGLILGVNPFDQPGVEAYKRNMFSLLGKPGFEDAELKRRAGI